MTKCFTYEISMLVQVLAEDKDEADAKVDREGGYLNPKDRKVKLVAATSLVEPAKLESVPSIKKAKGK